MRQSWWTPSLRSMTGMMLLVGAQGAAAPTAQAQQRDKDEWVWRHIDNDRRFEITLRGRVELTADERDVASLSRGGRLQIEEVIPGSPARMIIITADDGGGLNRVYLVNGRQQEWGTGGEAWLAQVLPRAAREHGMGAEARVRRIHGQRGAAGVLEEIEQIESASSRRAHLRGLIALGQIPAREMPRALRAIGTTSSSSGKAAMLRDLGAQLDLRNEAQRAAYFDVVGGISSSSERRGLLVETARRSDAASEPVLVRLLTTASRIPSSSERAAVLLAVADGHSLASERVREAFFDALNGIPSSSERRRVLLAVLERHGEEAAVTRSVIRAASGIPSDSEKTAVLLGVPLAQLRDDRTARLYRETTESIRSSSNRERVYRRLVGVEG